MPDGEHEIDVAAAEGRAFESLELWENPDPSLLDPQKEPPPGLPLDCFGEWAPMISDIAMGASAPEDYVAFALLAHAAAMIGNCIRVRPQPKRAPDWRNSTALWVALVGPPSSGKTPALQPFKSAITKIEKELDEKYRPRIEERDAAAEMAKLREKAWKAAVQKALRDGDTPPQKPTDAEVPPLVRIPRIRVMDTTIEKLVDTLRHNENGVLVFREELYGWFANMGRYSNGTDQPMWIELFDGGTIIVDRVKHTEPLKVNNAIVSIIGGIQPDRLSEVIAGADDGLFSRFLFIAPAIPPLNNVELHLDTRLICTALYELRELASQNSGTELQEFHQFDFSSEAADEFFLYRQRVRARVIDNDGLIAGWIGKGPGIVARLATILFLLDLVKGRRGHPCPAYIDLNYTKRAIRLWEEYLLPMTRRSFAGQILPPNQRAARRILLHAQETKAEIINERELKRKLKSDGLMLGSGNGPSPFQLLEELGWLRAANNRKGPTKGRTRQDWIVNPRIHEAIGPNGAIGTDRE